jgi:hypothetical protein
MNKYAKEYIRSFANVVSQKTATEPKLEEMVAGGKAVFNFLSKPFKDSWQNIQDAKYLKSIGDNQAANSKYWSAAGNLGMGGLAAVPIAGAASRVVMGSRAAAPAAASFIPRLLGATKNTLKWSVPITGISYSNIKGQRQLGKSMVGAFESSARQNYPEYSSVSEALTKPSVSSKQIIDTAVKPYNEMLSINPATQRISEKVKQLPVKERIEKSLPYERTLHEIQAMMSQ